MAESLQYRGSLVGHRGWGTCIAVTYKQCMIWELTPGEDYEREKQSPGYARRALCGHSEPVQDIVVSSDGQFALSASWDKTMRLWDLNTGSTVRTFQGHAKDVNSVAFSCPWKVR